MAKAFQRRLEEREIAQFRLAQEILQDPRPALQFRSPQSVQVQGFQVSGVCLSDVLIKNIVNKTHVFRRERIPVRRFDSLASIEDLAQCISQVPLLFFQGLLNKVVKQGGTFGPVEPFILVEHQCRTVAFEQLIGRPNRFLVEAGGARYLVHVFTLLFFLGPGGQAVDRIFKKRFRLFIKLQRFQIVFIHVNLHAKRPGHPGRHPQEPLLSPVGAVRQTRFEGFLVIGKNSVDQW